MTNFKKISLSLALATTLSFSGCGSSSNDDTTEDTTKPVFTSSATVTVVENQTSAIDVDATDANTIIYSISAGDDKALFDIDNASGVVTFKTAPDFENPADDNSDNSYTITVSATDTANNVETQDIIIEVSNDIQDSTPPTSLTKKWETNLDFPESAVYDNINNVIYVSNVNANATGDGWGDNNGFISKLDKNGNLVEKEFITGLKSPKGLVLNKEHLYVADVDTIVDINITNGVILNRFNAPNGVNRLNSLAYDITTNILYISDSSLHKIYKMTNNGSFSEFYDKEASVNAHQNGININLKNIIMQGEEGYIKSINIDTNTVSTISSSIDNIKIDGITKYYNLGYIVSSDTSNSKIYFVNNDGTSTLLLTTSSGAGDIFFSSDLKLLLVPNINDKIVAYEIVN